MADLKTRGNDGDVSAFLKAVRPERRRDEARLLDEMLARVSGCEARMWGTNIIGYGRYHYKYQSGREGDWFLTGFSPRKQALSIYIMPGFSAYGDLMSRLGKHKTGKSCLYLTKLANADFGVLEDLVQASVADMRRKYGVSG